jgi:urease accessory protein
MPWHAQLSLDYQHRDGRTFAHFSHDGPLRVLRSLYPQGPGICHHVLVHPPGGLVGGDTLDIAVRVRPQAHGLITTPGASRFYRSEGEPALQRTRLTLDSGARLEWLPLEAIAYDGCLARNQLELELAPDAELLAWDITALGLPHAQLPWLRGEFVQHLEWPGQWLEFGRIQAHDTHLLDGPLGLAGQRCVGSLVFASGTALSRQRRQLVLEATHELLSAHPHGQWCGATCPTDQVLVLRGLAPVVEPLMGLWQQVWALWRRLLWNLAAPAPRIWAM